MRINKYLSLCGEMSRRSADIAIESGRVAINGKKAVVGDSIDPETDKVLLDGRPIKESDLYYLAAYKPKYMVTTMHDPEGRACIKDIIPERYKGVFPAGRLDFDAEGLLLLTNDGDMANAVHHPSRNMSKVYVVTLKPQASLEALGRMARGVILDGKVTRQAIIQKVRDGNGSTIVSITLKQGLKNQIKRMAEAVGLIVTSIKRIAIGPVSLGEMKPGQIRDLSYSEIKELKNIQKKHKVT